MYQLHDIVFRSVLVVIVNDVVLPTHHSLLYISKQERQKEIVSDSINVSFSLPSYPLSPSLLTSFPLLIERFLSAATAAVTVSRLLLRNRGINASRPSFSTILPWLASSK